MNLETSFITQFNQLVEKKMQDIEFRRMSFIYQESRMIWRQEYRYHSSETNGHSAKGLFLKKHIARMNMEMVNMVRHRKMGNSNLIAVLSLSRQWFLCYQEETGRIWIASCHCNSWMWFCIPQKVGLGAPKRQERSIIHKNIGNLGDLRFILNNHELNVNKNKVSILCKESIQGQCCDF